MDWPGSGRGPSSSGPSPVSPAPAGNGSLVLQFKPEGASGPGGAGSLTSWSFPSGLTGPDLDSLVRVPGLKRNPDELPEGRDRGPAPGLRRGRKGPMGIAQATAQGRLAAIRAVAWAKEER